MRIIKYTLVSACFLLNYCYSFGQKVNYVRTWDAKRPTTSASIVTSSTNVAEVNQATEYFDGIGRPYQTVNKQASPLQKDMVDFKVYDVYGREEFKYLPYTSTTADGKFKAGTVAAQDLFYDGQLTGQGQTFYYAKTNFETSPLDRPVKELPAGNSWVGANRGTSSSYEMNVANEVRRWIVSATSQNVPTSSSFYAAGQLYRQVTADENGKRIVLYKDKQDNLILKKVEILTSAATLSSHTGWLSTYYVYDDVGSLRWVIQPQGVDKLINTYGWVFDNTTLLTSVIAKEQCFYYEYDARDRLIIKKTPGTTELEEMVYDTRDRLIMSRTPNLKAQGYWLINKYDNFNRLTTIALKPNTSTRATHQTSSDADINYPTLVANDIMQENYYNDYTWVTTQPGITPTLDATDVNNAAFFFTTADVAPEYAQTIASYADVKGKQTGWKVRIFGTSTYLYSSIFYDKEGRVIQTQEGNLGGGRTVVTTQYDFAGKILRKLYRQEKAAPNAKTIRELTKYSYDHADRVTLITKKIGPSGADKVIADNDYNELGQLKTKALGTGLEIQNFDYNIRGWLIGNNRNYITGVSSTNYFGYELGYDRAQTVISGQNYVTPSYTGNISGTVWKTVGDFQTRKYDFTYDAASRLLSADFNQLTGGTFNKTAGIDFSVSGLAYDANGNITAMQQKGWKLNTSSTIDNLTYTYVPNSNRLAKVTDANNDPNTKLGDFKDGANVNDDYTYDQNGNLITDQNKGMSSILYTHLNMPYEVNITGKGKITYLFDNLGRRWKKTIVDNTTPTPTTTVWLYIGNYVYKDDVLQYFTHEEGRARFDQTQAGSEATAFNFDYFLKDHLGNTRMVLTDETKSDQYVPLTFEGTSASAQVQNQDAIWDNATGASINVISSRDAKPANFDPSATNDDWALLVRKSTGAIGAAKLLKVMAGDKIHTSIDYYYTTANANNTGANGISSLIANFVSALTSSPDVAGSLKDAASLINTGLQNNTALTTLLNTPNATSGSNQAPKAYLNVIFFDDQFKYDGTRSTVIPVAYLVNAKGTIDKKAANAISVARNGYVYVYISNESDEMVYFDNFMLTHERGPILEETHYYPFGLTMAGISSRAMGAVQNKLRFNDGSELANQEFSDGSGLEWYETTYRDYDPQIGRFHQIDPLAEDVDNFSPYAYANDNPIYFNDPLGLLSDSLHPQELTSVTVTAVKSKNPAASQRILSLLSDDPDQETINNVNRFVNATDGLWPSVNPLGAGRMPRPPASKEDEELAADLAIEAVTSFIPFSKIFRAPKYLKWIKRLARIRSLKRTSKLFAATERQLQAKFKHAADFGVTGNYNKANASKFLTALNEHVNNPAVTAIQGTYRGNPVIHHLNPSTGLNVISQTNGLFISGWKLNPAQLQNVLKHGGL